MHIDYRKTTLAIIFSIIIIGLIAIPLGNPKFIYRAIALELSFVILSVFLWKGYTQALYAIVLIVGGYILQALLIFFSIKYISEIRSKKLSKTL